MAINKKKNKQLLTTLSHDLIKEVDSYQSIHNIKSRNEAIRQLIKKALEGQQ